MASRALGPNSSAEPVIDFAEHVGLSEVDVLGVADLVGQRVLGGEPAEVVGAGRCSTCRSSSARTGRRAGRRAGRRRAAGRAACAGSCCRARRASPGLARSLPSLMIGGWASCSEKTHLSAGFHRMPGGVAERDVLDVEQDFVGALAVPHLVAGVAGVGEDRADGALGPGDADRGGCCAPGRARTGWGCRRGSGPRRWRRCRARR